MSILDKSSDVWHRVFLHYEDVMRAKAATHKDKKKGKDLLKFDIWYQEELAAVLSQRSDKCIKHDELAKLMKWKLMRGKFRPRLQELAESNSAASVEAASKKASPQISPQMLAVQHFPRGKFRPRLQELAESNSAASVEAASKKAFKALPNLRSAIEALTVLRGIGPATASAVLAVGAPHLAPFMADESMQALPGLQPLSYTLPAFMNYAQQVSQITKSLQAQGEFEWTPHKVEKVLWTVEMAKKLNQNDVLHLLDTDDTKSSQSGGKRKSTSKSSARLKKKTKVDLSP
ncbi:hypothetical protein ACOMHN_009965 [Nucella lapillus]